MSEKGAVSLGKVVAVRLCRGVHEGLHKSHAKSINRGSVVTNETKVRTKGKRNQEDAKEPASKKASNPVQS